MFKRPGMAVIKSEPCSPLNSVDEGNWEISLDEENYDELNEKVAQWVLMKSSNEIFFKCEQLKQEDEESGFVELEIQINVAELMDFNAIMGNYLIKQPRKFLKSLRWAIFTLIKSNNWLRISIVSQIIIIPRLTSFPTFAGSKLESRLISEERLTKIFGTVVSLTPVSQYTKGTKYNCSQENCIAAQSNGEFYAWIPGSSETSIVRSGQKCNYCNAVMQEDVQRRKLAEQRSFKIIYDGGIRCLDPCNRERYERHQALTVIARDSLMRCMELGHRYWITGMLIVDWSQRISSPSFTNTLEALHIEQACSVPVKQIIAEDEIPAPIKQLYENNIASPWNFVATLAYHFGNCICIGGAYHKLKLVLLLSASLTGDDNFLENMNGKVFIGNDLRKIHIFAIAEDLLTIQRLFTYASGFCERSTVNQPTLDLFGNVCQEIDGTIYVDGGSLLLAGRHVCIIQNIISLKKDDREKLQKALEERSFSVDTSKHIHLSQMTFPLKCTVWAVAESNSSQNEVKDADIKRFAEEFDLVYDFTNEYSPSLDIEKDQIHEIMMKRSVGLHNQNEIMDEDIKMFLEFVRLRRVSFSQNASEMIKDFYLASRRARNIGYSRTEINKSALQTMISLAAAHAKLSLHKEVTMDDALIAIILYEESITMRFGKSVIDLKPKLHFQRKSVTDHVGSKNEEQMMMLQMKVTSFIRTFAGATGRFYFTEE